MIKCPNCNIDISESSRSCPNCGFDKISSYLLHLERENQSKIVDYTSFHNSNPIVYDSKNTPKCPTCQSTNLKKISGTKRLLSTGLFGLASSNIGKTFECRSCGYKW